MHEHDDQGRLVRTVATTEAEWDAESYGLVAALADYEATLCPKHGGPIDECTDPLSDPDNPRSTLPWVGKVAGRCFATDATLRKQAEIHDKDSDVVRPDALLVTAVRVPRAPRVPRSSRPRPSGR